MKKAKAKQPQLSLDEIAARLMQAEVGETEALTQLADALGQFLKTDAQAAGSSASVRKLVEAAKHKLDAVLAGEAADAEQALAAAVRLACLATSPSEPSAEPELEWDAAAAPPVAAAPAQAEQALHRPTLIPAEPDTDLIVEFLTEANEHVVNAEAALLTLEQKPEDAAAVNTVFRAFHTVKGVSAMLGMTALAELAHHAESLLARIRDGQIRCTGVYANLCLRGIDMLKATLTAVSAQLKGQDAELPEGYAELVRALQNPDDPPAATTEAVCEPAPASPPAPAPAAAAAVPAPELATAAPASSAQASSQSDESSVRVRTDRLDRLIDMVGELVIAHSMLAADPNKDVARDPDLARKVGHAGKIVRELQDMSMSLRMVPLRPTFQKLTRIVRDVAKKSDKLIQFVSTGDDTEIDRNMVDVIAEPLIHMVRNAADHGIEATAARIAAGKSPTGTVRLAAYHSGGSVVIDLSDDGGGLDRERILAKAAQKGLIDPSKSLSDSEIYQLIFLPGFSTTENVTDISGRGVGMDVVRRNIEQLKGRIEISSERGRGTTFSIRLPLTLAITDGMIVRVGGERYIIPTVNIAMNFRPEASHVSTVVGRGEVILLRGELIPLFRLHQLFKVKGAVEEPTRGLVVVLRDGVGSCGLLVDELLGQQQVVAKSLGSGIGKVAAVSGGAILGDGRVGLILDPGSLVALAKESRCGRPQPEPARHVTSPEQSTMVQA